MRSTSCFHNVVLANSVLDLLSYVFALINVKDETSVKMRKSVSLKEFSTTPTVSCMLRKDGNNVAAETAQQTSVVRTNIAAVSAQSGAKAPSAQGVAEQQQDGMWEME